MTRDRKSALTWAGFALAVVFTAVVGVLALVSGAEEVQHKEDGAFVRGSFTTWEVITECEKGSDPCTRVLDKYNAQLRPEGMVIYEDGSLAVIG